MNANLKAVFDCFVEKSLLKCLGVNDNVNHVYLMTSFSMSRSLFLQLLSSQFFGLTRYWLKRQTSLENRIYGDANMTKRHTSAI